MAPCAEVHYNGAIVPRLEHTMLAENQFNFSARLPVISDPCGSNFFSAWQNKLHVVVCGGVPSAVESGLLRTETGTLPTPPLAQPHGRSRMDIAAWT